MKEGNVQKKSYFSNFYLNLSSFVKQESMQKQSDQTMPWPNKRETKANQKVQEEAYDPIESDNETDSNQNQVSWLIYKYQTFNIRALKLNNKGRKLWDKINQEMQTTHSQLFDTFWAVFRQQEVSKQKSKYFW